MGIQESGSYEFKMMASNGTESGVVPSQSGQESKTKIYYIKEEITSNARFCSGFGITWRRILVKKRMKERDRKNDEEHF